MQCSNKDQVDGHPYYRGKQLNLASPLREPMGLVLTSVLLNWAGAADARRQTAA